MMRYFFLLTLSIVIVSVCFFVLLNGKHIWLINRARRRGFTPKNDKPTMFHVRELIIQGEKELAIQMYCQIFKVNRQAARREVENLEKSVKEKNM